MTMKKPRRSINTATAAAAATFLLCTASSSFNHTATAVDTEYPYRLFRQSQHHKEARIRKRNEMIHNAKTANNDNKADNDGSAEAVDLLDVDVPVEFSPELSYNTNNRINNHSYLNNNSNSNGRSKGQKYKLFHNTDCEEDNSPSSAKAAKAKGGKSKSSKSKSSKSKAAKGMKASKCNIIIDPSSRAPTMSPAPSLPPVPTTEPVRPIPTSRPTPKPVQPTLKPTPSPTSKVCVPLNPNPYTFEPPKNVFPIEPWTTEGDGVWAIDPTTAYTGTYSIKSPNFDGEPLKQVSNATLEVCDNFEGGPLVFYTKASVLPPQDVFIVYIDGVVAAQLVDVQDFEEVKLELKPGAHRVDFSYQYNIFNLDPCSTDFDNIPNKILGAVWIDSISIGNVNPPAPPAETDQPTRVPTDSPTLPPTSPPTDSPTLKPTVSPTLKPTVSPTLPPSASPTMSARPSALIFPSASPTVSSMPSTTPPTTLTPSKSPTVRPTVAPTIDPTVAPSPNPTQAPVLITPEPTTASPTLEPTLKPTLDPTLKPTPAPVTPAPITPAPVTAEPTVEPTLDPTVQPTLNPTPPPIPIVTTEPTQSPTLSPTLNPSKGPTLSPTLSPTISPTSNPTFNPTPSIGRPSVSPAPSISSAPSTPVPSVSSGPSVSSAPTTCFTPDLWDFEFPENKFPNEPYWDNGQCRDLTNLAVFVTCNKNWSITFDQADTGTFSLESPSMDALGVGNTDTFRASARLSICSTSPARNLRFRAFPGAARPFDQLVVLDNGVRRFELRNANKIGEEWITSSTISLSAGAHTIEFQYEYNPSGINLAAVPANPNRDGVVWIDNVELF